MKPFKLHADYSPSGDQPQAIQYLVDGLNHEQSKQILMGVTGSGKTFTMANIIATLNRPALILAHNKTLAAQLCAEFKAFFPENAVEYFISYYDYYQPEAYIAARDVYIEKEADINQEIERLRHSATRSLVSRKDVIIVASVSCIYGLGIPEDYLNAVFPLEVGKTYSRKKLFKQLMDSQYERNDIDLQQGRFRVKGDTVDIFPSWDEYLIRLHFFGDELEQIAIFHPVSMEIQGTPEKVDIYPATHYIVGENKERAIQAIKTELDEQIKLFKSQGKELEANRIKARTLYDIDMLQEVGYCKGIENYSRHLSGRNPGEPGGVLLDFFPKDFITFIDESHVTVPQIRGMYNGDQSRKQALVDFGFRLPSSKDNRPLTFSEFENKIGQTIYVSATPGPFELESCLKSPSKTGSKNWKNYFLAEQIIRPTGLLDPIVILKKTDGQMPDLLQESEIRIAKNERVLITTLTKQFAEDLCDYFKNQNIKVQYIHSDISALDRVDILHDLRAGKYDVLIGVNLLREGLDLPEVSLVAILDADKEGFLRNERSLIQTIGRAARHENGTVILYADKVTDSMKAAISETNRRRSIQEAHNKKHNITPKTVIKKLSDIREDSRKTLDTSDIKQKMKNLKASQLPNLLQQLETDMKKAAESLEFELAAVIRDQIEELKNMPLK